MFWNIGGLPSNYKWYDFKVVKVRDILIQDLNPLELARLQSRVADLVSVLSSITNLTEENTYCLTLGDAVYIMAYLRKACYTESHLTLTWDCNASTVKNSKGIVFPEYQDLNDKELKILKLHRDFCGTKNTNLVYSYQYKFKPVIPDWTQITIPNNCHVPTLKDLHILEEWQDTDPKLYIKYERFFNQLLCLNGNTVDEKICSFKQAFDLKQLNLIKKFHDDSYHGIDLMYDLQCNCCHNKPTVTQSLTAHEVLPNISSSSVMNMQYNLMQTMNSIIAENTPIKKLLYWHSTHQKHEQERAQKRAALKNTRRRR
jgi:hypothetical protein